MTMTDRVYPGGESPQVVQGDEELPLVQTTQGHSPNRSLTLTFPAGKTAPQPGTYVVHIPKDQVICRPPPRHFVKESHARRRRNSCCCCFCWFLSLVIFLIVLAALCDGVLYLVYRPKAPGYTVEQVSIQGLNLSSSGSSLSPKVAITVRADNPNSKIGIYYRKGSSVDIFHSHVQLCTGVWPEFYQPAKNVTSLQAALEGSGLHLSTGDYNALREQQKKKEISLRLNLKVPVKLKIGSVRTWTITVKVRCDITVDELTTKAKIGSNKCKVDVKP